MSASASEVALLHLGYSLDSLRCLPKYARDDDPIYPEVREWCLEAFYMHARVVADFFVKMPPQDYTARTYIPDWALADADSRGVLNRAWLVATKHVAHLSRQRILAEGDVPEQTNYEGLSLITDAAVTAADQFVVDYRRSVPNGFAVETLLSSSAN